MYDMSETKYKKFLFNTSFDEAAKPKAPPKPMYTREQLDQEKADAFRQGREEGYTQGVADAEKRLKTSLEAALEDILKKMSGEFPRLQHESTQHQQKLMDEAESFIYSALSRLFPYLDEREGLQEIQKILADSMNILREQQKLNVRVHPDLVQEIQRIFEQNLGLNLSLIQIASDSAFGRGDIAIDWGQGGVERKSKDAFQKLKDKLSQDLKVETPLTETIDAKDITREDNQGENNG